MRIAIKKSMLTLAGLIIICMLLPAKGRNVRAATNITNVSTSAQFWNAFTNANNGDIINVTSNINIGYKNEKNVKSGCVVTINLNGYTLTCGSGQDNFGVNANSVLIFENGKMDYLDTTATANGIIILNNVKITATAWLGKTTTWIVNNSSVQTLSHENAAVNPGASDLHPIASTGTFSGTYSYANTTPAMVGSGTTWKCFSTLQGCFDQSANSGYNRVIMLKDYTLPGNTTLSTSGIEFNLSEYTLNTGSYSLTINNSSSTNTILNGFITGDISMGANTGQVILNNIDVSGTIGNGTHPVSIQSGHYNNIASGSELITIEGGFFKGTLSGRNILTKNGYFTKAPAWDYLPANYDAVVTSKTEKGIVYNYTIARHTHAFIHTANGNTLTSTCNTGACLKTPTTASLDLSPVSPTFSGEDILPAWKDTQTINFAVSGDSAWKSATGLSAIPAIKYVGTGQTTYMESTTKPTTAGFYKATLSYGGATAYVDFEIKKVVYVHFSANGGKGYKASIEKIAGDTIDIPRLPTPFMAPINKDYSGWSLSSNGPMITDDSIELTNSITLYVRWIDHNHHIKEISLGSNIKKEACLDCDFYIIRYK